MDFLEEMSPTEGDEEQVLDYLAIENIEQRSVDDGRRVLLSGGFAYVSYRFDASVKDAWWILAFERKLPEGSRYYASRVVDSEGFYVYRALVAFSSGAHSVDAARRFRLGRDDEDAVVEVEGASRGDSFMWRHWVDEKQVEIAAESTTTFGERLEEPLKRAIQVDACPDNFL